MANRVIIYAFSGKAGSGKDTSASMLQNYILEKGGFRPLSFHKISFAKPLKDMAVKYFPICDPVVKDPVSRQILQGLGTVMREEVSPNFWVDRALNEIRQIAKDAPRDAVVHCFITDLRFVNEADRIQGLVLQSQFPCDVILIRLNNRNALTGEAAQHVSETDLDDYDYFNYVYDNTGTLEELETFIRSIYDNITD